jgi:hypothetical protein
MTVAQRNADLLCEIKHIHGVPYHTVRPTAVMRIESWTDLLFYAESEFGKVTSFERSIVGTVGRPPVLGQRVYVDNTRFWFKHKADCDRFIEYWS